MVAVPPAIGHRNVDGNDDRRRRVRTLDGEDEPEREEDGEEVREHRGLTLARLWRRRGRGSLESTAMAAASGGRPRRLEASRDNSFFHEVEDVEADLQSFSPELGAAGDGGAERWPARLATGACSGESGKTVS